MTPSTFTITEEDLQVVRAFLEEHKCAYHGRPDSYAGAIGGAIAYRFTPTGLGVICWVICACGTKKCVTAFKDF